MIKRPSRTGGAVAALALLAAIGWGVTACDDWPEDNQGTEVEIDLDKPKTHQKAKTSKPRTGKR